MLDQDTILYTGGSGLLGRELRALLPRAHFPSRAEFDVADHRAMESFIQARVAATGTSKRLCTVVHGAAFTSPPRVDQDPGKALETNIIGTASIVRLAREYELRVIYISTDYVFPGDRGNYCETDAVAPVNKYAWSKLGGECAVRMHEDSLIIRTSFGPNTFPYPRAFDDQYTSREAVATFARKLVAIIGSEVRGVLHVGGPRRSVYEYAKSLDPSREIGRLSINEVSFWVPADTSLDTSKYRALFGEAEVKVEP